MRKISQTRDMSGRKMHKGDTVVIVRGSVTAKVCDIAVESDSTAFVCLRAVHRPFSRGIWHAADQVMWVSAARR
jgi:hypothetical protein